MSTKCGAARYLMAVRFELFKSITTLDGSRFFATQLLRHTTPGTDVANSVDLKTQVAVSQLKVLLQEVDMALQSIMDEVAQCRCSGCHSTATPRVSKL
jgi:hypothetical protein